MGIELNFFWQVHEQFSPNSDENNPFKPKKIGFSIHIMIKSAIFLSTNEGLGYIGLEGNVSIFLIGQEASQPFGDSNTLKTFLNPKQYATKHGLV